MSSSLSSSSSSEDGNGNDNNNSNGGARRGADFEETSLTRRHANNEIWPGPFLEDLVVQFAIDTCPSLGRLAAASALANVFQVCSTWRAVSHSVPLWFRLTRIIWGHPTWRDEYVYRHRTARNFRIGRSYHNTLQRGGTRWADLSDDTPMGFCGTEYSSERRPWSV